MLATALHLALSAPIAAPAPEPPLLGVRGEAGVGVPYMSDIAVAMKMMPVEAALRDMRAFPEFSPLPGRGGARRAVKRNCRSPPIACFREICGDPQDRGELEGIAVTSV
jgi:hypothetical protein